MQPYLSAQAAEAVHLIGLMRTLTDTVELRIVIACRACGERIAGVRDYGSELDDEALGATLAFQVPPADVDAEFEQAFRDIGQPARNSDTYADVVVVFPERRSASDLGETLPGWCTVDGARSLDLDRIMAAVVKARRTGGTLTIRDETRHGR